MIITGTAHADDVTINVNGQEHQLRPQHARVAHLPAGVQALTARLDALDQAAREAARLAGAMV
jgi:hypothetical protein